MHAGLDPVPAPVAEEREVVVIFTPRHGGKDPEGHELGRGDLFEDHLLFVGANLHVVVAVPRALAERQSVRHGVRSVDARGVLCDDRVRRVAGTSENG